MYVFFSLHDLTFVLLLTLRLCGLRPRRRQRFISSADFKVGKINSSVLIMYTILFSGGNIHPRSSESEHAQQVSVLHCWTYNCFNHISIDWMHWHFSCRPGTNYKSHSALTNILNKEEVFWKSAEISDWWKGRTITQPLTPLSSH